MIKTHLAKSLLRHISLNGTETFLKPSCYLSSRLKLVQQRPDGAICNEAKGEPLARLQSVPDGPGQQVLARALSLRTTINVYAITNSNILRIKPLLVTALMDFGKIRVI